MWQFILVPALNHAVPGANKQCLNEYAAQNKHHWYLSFNSKATKTFFLLSDDMYIKRWPSYFHISFLVYTCISLGKRALFHCGHFLISPKWIYFLNYLLYVVNEVKSGRLSYLLNWSVLEDFAGHYSSLWAFNSCAVYILSTTAKKKKAILKYFGLADYWRSCFSFHLFVCYFFLSFQRRN